jgi:hypothetical protein
MKASNISGSAYRRKSAACLNFDMVWQYRSPIPVGVGGGVIPCSNDFYLPLLRVHEGGGGPCGQSLYTPAFYFSLILNVCDFNGAEIFLLDPEGMRGRKLRGPLLLCILSASYA